MPAMVGLLGNRDPPTRIRCRPALRQDDFRFTQLANNLFRLVPLAHFQTPSGSKITKILDHFEGGRSGEAGRLKESDIQRLEHKRNM